MTGARLGAACLCAACAALLLAGPAIGAPHGAEAIGLGICAALGALRIGGRH